MTVAVAAVLSPPSLFFWGHSLPNKKVGRPVVAEDANADEYSSKHRSFQLETGCRLRGGMLVLPLFLFRGNNDDDDDDSNNPSGG